MRHVHFRSGFWLSLTAGCAFWFAACGSDFSAAAGAGGAADVAGESGQTTAASETVGGGSEGGHAESGGAPSAGEGTVSPSAGSGGEQGGAAPTEPSYRQVVLQDEPLVYWRMGASKNRVVADETGGGNDLVLQGTGQELGVEGALEGDPDLAIGFDGVASFAIATDARAFDFVGGAKFTLECWARWARWEAGGGSYFQYLFSNVAGVAGNRDGFALYLFPEPAQGVSPRSVFEYDRPAADLGVWGPVIDAGTWGHYVSVFDGKQAALYVNGTLTDTEVTAGSIVARTVPFTVGRAAGVDGSYFKGALDELAIYARPLTSAEIAEHFSFARAP
jgi:Concanavalin A-like lectin/glucanases superfamily